MADDSYSYNTNRPGGSSVAMETKLLEAAVEGNISSLQKLLNDDPLILDRFSVNCFSDTPLHVAALLGHTHFVREIISIKPHLINELNSHQSSPLHLASAKGYVDVVKSILSVDNRTCLARDRNGLTPLHLSAIKGRIEVMKMLLRANPKAAQVTIYKEETILHLCVKHFQLESLKLLLGTTLAHPRFINSKDADGNNVLHLAVADKQVETINFLVSVPGFEVNALNLNGLTPMDVLNQSRRDVRDLEIDELLKNGGGVTNLETNTPPHRTQIVATKMQKNNTWKGLTKQQADWLERKRSALMIVASLIATMAFQVGVNPPSGVWQETKYVVDAQGVITTTPEHTAGYSVFAHNYPRGFTRFCIINTTGFIASLSIILLLMSGLPIRRRFFMWFLMVITWISITAIALAYTISIIVLTPDEEFSRSVSKVIGITVLAWLCLMALLIFIHTIRMFVKMVRKIRKTFRGRSSATSSTVLGE